MSREKDVVILTSFSLHHNNASSCDDTDKWIIGHEKKIITLRNHLSEYLDSNKTIALDMEIRHKPDWHINLIGRKTVILIVLNLGLISFYETRRDYLTENDRHTYYVVSIIKSFDSNPNCTKSHFFLIFDSIDINTIPVLWHCSVKYLKGKKVDYDNLIAAIKGESIVVPRRLNESISFQVITDKAEADFINYWKKIFCEDRSHLLSCKYFIDRNLSHQPISYFEAFEKALRNDNVDKSLMISQLYGNDINNENWKSKIILIHGAMGSGKSTIVHILSHYWAKSERLTMFRAVIPIKINNNNFKDNLIQLVNFVQYESEESKVRILNGFLKTPGEVLFIFDIENYPWRDWSEFYISDIGQFLLNNKSNSILVLTNLLSYGMPRDKQLMNHVDIIYELQCFNHEQLKHFFRKKKCLIDMKCSEIFQELCKFPLYAAMIPHNNHITQYSNLTLFCKDIVQDIIIKNISNITPPITIALESLHEYPRIYSLFSSICDLAWEFVLNSTNMGELNGKRVHLFNEIPDGLGFIDQITKPDPNKKGIMTNYIFFRLTTIQYFLAAFHFVHFLCAPIGEIGRRFLSGIGQCHPIHHVWRFITGLLTDIEKKNALLEALGGNQAPPKLQYVQAISESGLEFLDVTPKLKNILSTWINSFRWEKIKLYPSDCLAIITTFKYLDNKEQLNILKEIQDVYFSNCNLDNEGMIHLIEVLSKFRNVRHINLGGNSNLLNPLSRNGCVGYINEILRNNCSTMTELFISASGLTNTGLRILKPAFYKLKNLKQLDLSRNTEMGPEGWYIFVDILENLKIGKLSKLFLADNNIDAECLERILFELSSFRTITWLNLSGNKVNYNTMTCLIDVLKGNKLRKLFLSNCFITNQVLKILLCFIDCNQDKINDLVSLALSWNKFDNYIMEDIMKSLRVTTKLQKLMLDHNKIGSESSMEILSKSLCHMTQLGELSISRCHIDNLGASYLAPASKHVTIDLRKNNIDNPEKLELHSHTIFI